MRLLTLALALLLLPLVAMAEISPDAGAYGFQFLQIPVNPIASALGGTGIYADNYAGAFLNNPAANVLESNRSISVNHSLWLVDTSCSQLIYGNGSRRFHFGLAGRILDYGDIETRDDTGAIIGNYHPLDANLLVNFAFRVLPSHLVGINAGLLYEKLDTASSYGLSTDLGYIYLPPIVNTTVFASVKNIGMTSKMQDESIKLPATYETGISYKLKGEDLDISLQIAANKATDTAVRFIPAAELTVLKMLDLRMGYKTSATQGTGWFVPADGYTTDANLTAGFGVNWQSLQVDYGWTAFSDKLNDTHAFGITYHF